MYKLFTKLTALAAVALLSATFMPGSACAAAKPDDVIVLPFGMNSELVGDVVWSCKSRPGPTIGVDGLKFTLSGLRVHVKAWKNKNHGAEADAEYDGVLVSDNFSFSVPKQPSQGGAGGNPWWYGVAIDEDDVLLTDEQLLGRCKDTSKGRFDKKFLKSILALIAVSIDCKSRPGPTITFDGSLTLVGDVRFRMVGRNNAQGTHETGEFVTAPLTVASNGFVITFPKQPAFGGVTGNPSFEVTFFAADGSQIGDAYTYNKCQGGGQN